MSDWKGDLSRPVVSICCIAYNHKKYIAEAIDSFLSQETDFVFEIIIRDDASTDDTAKILREYENNFPNIIKPIYEIENGYRKGVKPLPVTYKKAKGEYLALCEGDDYWTDKKKLQIQKDFLDRNSDYSGCAHQIVVLSNTDERLFSKNIPADLYLNDLLFERPFHTASLFFHAKYLRGIPYPPAVLSGDKALYLLLSINGVIRYIDRTMGIYRKHREGISSYVTYEMMKTDLNMLPWILNLDSNFPKYKLLSMIHKTIVLYPKKIFILDLMRHSFYFVLYSFSYFPKNIRAIGVFILRGLPSVAKKIYYSDKSHDKDI